MRKLIMKIKNARFQQDWNQKDEDLGLLLIQIRSILNTPRKMISF